MAKKPPAPKKPGGFAQALPKPVAPKPNRIPGPRPSAPKPPPKGQGIVPPRKGPLGPQGQKPTQNVPPSYKPNWKGDDWKPDSPYKPATPGKMGPKPKNPGMPRPNAPKKKSAAPKPSGSVTKKK
jgi:hypothetical protein